MIRILVLFELALLALLGVDRLVVNKAPLLPATVMQVLPTSLWPAAAPAAAAPEPAAGPDQITDDRDAANVRLGALSQTDGAVQVTLRRPANAVANVASSR